MRVSPPSLPRFGKIQLEKNPFPDEPANQRVKDARHNLAVLLRGHKQELAELTAGHNLSITVRPVRDSEAIGAGVEYHHGRDINAHKFDSTLDFSRDNHKDGFALNWSTLHRIIREQVETAAIRQPFVDGRTLLRRKPEGETPVARRKSLLVTA